MITGELIDEKHEATVRKLKQEIEECRRKSKEQGGKDCATVKQDNIDLANELEDRKHIIDAYEKAAGKRKVENRNLPRCHMHVIVEEMDTHTCRVVKDYMIEGRILWLFDGFQWYPRKLLATQIQHPNATPIDSTEPR
jgi:hypothetical protein